MRRLGARAITALVVPTREVAWQILALNTEKAHNLKERSLEVIRIYRDLLAEDGSRPESSFAFYLEDPALVTLGVCYEKQPRFAGGAYHPVLRRTERFVDDPLEERRSSCTRSSRRSCSISRRRSSAAVARLKERGLTSPYLRSFVVSRINPLRWIQGDLPPAEKVIAQMRDRAAKFNAERVKQEDLARMAGGGPTTRPRPRRRAETRLRGRSVVSGSSWPRARLVEAVRCSWRRLADAGASAL